MHEQFDVALTGKKLNLKLQQHHCATAIKKNDNIDLIPSQQLPHTPEIVVSDSSRTQSTNLVLFCLCILSSVFVICVMLQWRQHTFNLSANINILCCVAWSLVVGGTLKTNSCLVVLIFALLAYAALVSDCVQQHIHVNVFVSVVLLNWYLYSKFSQTVMGKLQNIFFFVLLILSTCSFLSLCALQFFFNISANSVEIELLVLFLLISNLFVFLNASFFYSVEFNCFNKFEISNSKR